ncbi:MAG: PaaI family thioesterase [Desulfobacterales bacterium]
MDIHTHRQIDNVFCGTPVMVAPDISRIELKTTETMQVDDFGLVHGGFIFGLADHAAMLAVNDPNVVLAGATVKFLKPVRAGESVTAEATTTDKQGKNTWYGLPCIGKKNLCFPENLPALCWTDMCWHKAA